MELPVMRRLKKELDELRHELKTKLPKELEVAREHGDLRENAEYEACKERQGYPERPHRADRAAHSGPVALHASTRSRAMRSATAARSRWKTPTTAPKRSTRSCFPRRSMPAAGLISIGSPLGRALLNREVGDEVDVATPKGKRSFQIVELRTIHEREDMNAP